ncbi:MAG: PDZ domain-containing protein [Kiritimatiellaeota bacterium]|nr:PDZ domain-containing protein [Kiritimatiellota bacterium]
MKKILWLVGALALVAGPARAEKIAYLGVATVPMEPVAAYQLNLPEGVGLAVVEVAEDGVVKGKLAEHDILQKLDDQILTSPEQLAVLVRSHKPGDSVKLTALRKGKEEVIKVTLGETDARKFAQPMRGHGGSMAMPPMPGVDPGRMMQQWQRPWQNRDEEATPPQVQRRERGPRTETQTETHSSSVISESRDGLSVTITDRDGQKTVRAEEDGKVIVNDKPINTEAQLKALPDKVRDRVAEMQKTIKVETQMAPRSKGGRHTTEL